MGELKRYSCYSIASSGIRVTENSFGDFVEFKDARKLQEENEKLKAERNVYLEGLIFYSKLIVDYGGDFTEVANDAIEKGKDIREGE